MTTTLPIQTEAPQAELAELLDLAETRGLLKGLSAVLGAELELLDTAGKTVISAGVAAGGGPWEEISIPEGDGRELGLLRVRPGKEREGGPELLARIAAVLGRLASHRREMRHRQAELTTIYSASMMLAEARDLNSVLTRTVRLVSEVMGVKGASIRLIDEDRDELRFVAVHGLSQAYLSSAPLRLSRAAIDLAAIRNGHEQVLDLRGD